MSIIDRSADLDLAADAGLAHGATAPSRRPVMRKIGERGPAHAPPSLRHLRAVVLLDGNVRKTPLGEALDVSLLELPLERDRNLLDFWRDEICSLSSGLELAALPARLIVGGTSRPPTLRKQDRIAGMSVEPDLQELRGTGGVLRDLVADYADDDVLLVANAAQLLCDSLLSLTTEAAARGGDVTVVANADGTPASISLISCRALRELPAVGFIDLKEQGLPLMATRHDVRVHLRSVPAGLPIRTPQDYLKALKAYHRAQQGETLLNEAFSERWRRRFSIVEDGASVSDEADLHNSVVLRGGRVEAGAFLANSIVCAGGVVRRRDQVIGRLIDAAGRKPIDQNSR